MSKIALLLLVCLGGPGFVAAQQADAPPPAGMSAGELDQLVAPIALYPDPLLAQVLSAVVFPADVARADRWVRQHKDLNGQQLKEEAVKTNLPCDPSVLSLIPFPAVLDTLSGKPDWATSLGKAVLTQRGDVMDAVRRMRRKAGLKFGIASEPIRVKW